MSGIIAQNSGRHTGLVKAGSSAGVWNLIKTYTASSDSDLSFVEGTDDVDFTAYDEFVFKFINIHPSGSGDTGAQFSFNFSVDTGSNYNVAKTTTWFEASHRENDQGGVLTYNTSRDLAQGTGFLQLSDNFDSHANDYNLGGYMQLFGPSNTTFVKNFMAVVNFTNSDYSYNAYIAGYGNTTSAVDAVQFKFSTGDIDAGTISLYGIT